VINYKNEVKMKSVLDVLEYNGKYVVIDKIVEAKPNGAYIYYNIVENEKVIDKKEILCVDSVEEFHRTFNNTGITITVDVKEDSAKPVDSITNDESIFWNLAQQFAQELRSNPEAWADEKQERHLYESLNTSFDCGSTTIIQEVDEIITKEEDMSIIKSSGKTQEFESGAHRDSQDGKGRFDLIPTIALKRLAQHYESGANKYGENNWKRGMPLRRFLDSAFRHLIQCLEGKEDEDHAASVIWNICGFIYTKDAILRGELSEDLNNLDNLPKLDKDCSPDVKKTTNKADVVRFTDKTGVEYGFRFPSIYDEYGGLKNK
jgi:hypothetical protein